MPDQPGDIPMPPHAYVPGQNARHPEDLFDPIKDSLTPGIPPGRLHETTAWAAGMVYLDGGYFWECHEVLEAVWMQTPVGSVEREMVQAIIQLANARLKLLMDRPQAVGRLCSIVRDHLQRCPTDRPVLGLRVPDLLVQVSAIEAALLANNAL